MNINLYNEFLSKIERKLEKQKLNEKEFSELAKGIITAIDSEISFAEMGTTDDSGVFCPGDPKVEDGKLPFAVSVKFKDKSGKELFVAVVNFIATKDGLDFYVQSVEGSKRVLVMNQDRQNIVALKSVVDLLGDPIAAQVDKFVGKKG